MPKVIEVQTTPFIDQIPKTSGLRKKTLRFLERNYIQNYIQSIFNTLSDITNSTLVIGGDGRYYNKEAISIAISMAIANGVKCLYIGHNGAFSTPALSLFIKDKHANLGLIFSASHNLGGLEYDFGIKVNSSDGAPASLDFNDLIIANTKSITSYKILDDFNIDLSKVGEYKFLNTQIIIVNPVDGYLNYLAKIFDFDPVYNLLHSKQFHFLFNGLHGISGIYAKELFVNRLNCSEDILFNCDPKEDFAGIHPDPCPYYMKDFIECIASKYPNTSLVAANDADADRFAIFNSRIFLEPSDSLALMLQYAHLFPYYENVLGVARSVTNSEALDMVAKKLNLNCYQVPSGWKHFANLFKGNKITLCGEDSFGIGSSHCMEKDGLWAVMFILSIIARTGLSIEQLLYKLWQEFGRVYYLRYDVNNLSEANIDKISKQIAYYAQRKGEVIYPNYQLKGLHNFSYQDPITKRNIDNQGTEISFEDGTTIFVRFSGTSTEGETMRLYIQKHETKKDLLNLDKFLYFKEIDEAIKTIFGNIATKSVIRF